MTLMSEQIIDYGGGELHWALALQRDMYIPGRFVWVTDHTFMGPMSNPNRCSGCGRDGREIAETADVTRINQPCRNPGFRQ